MIGVPFLVLGLLLVLSAVVGARVEARRGSMVGTFVLSPLHPATWRATLAIVLGFWVELVAISILLGAISSGTSTLIIGIGFVFVGVAIEVARLVARVERWRTRLADPRPLRPHPYRPYGRSLREFLLAVFADPNRWRDVIYVLVAAPLTVLELTAAVALWTTALVLVSVPIWVVLAGLDSVPGITSLPIQPAAAAAPAGVVGVILVPVAASASQGLMALSEIGGFRTMGDIGVLFIGMENELIHVVEGHAEAGVHSAGLLQPSLDQFGIDQFSDERCSDHLDFGSGDQFLYLPGDILCRIEVHISFSNEGIDDPLALPAMHGLIRRSDEESHIRCFKLFLEVLITFFHLDHG